jgi:hypothetical protein
MAPPIERLLSRSFETPKANPMNGVAVHVPGSARDWAAVREGNMSVNAMAAAKNTLLDVERIVPPGWDVGRH